MDHLQRMPLDGTGKRGYCTPGGYMALMGEAMEEEVLRVARQDAERALSLVTQHGVTKYELVQALVYMAQTTKAAVDVAECRQERLDDMS
ncbi:hypothetical protein [Streptomyces rochei]|uniref:hypothetical protein n=1 Tax=Streptomyces rochei TaxID=1928 RepID=UPI0036C123B1